MRRPSRYTLQLNKVIGALLAIAGLLLGTWELAVIGLMITSLIKLELEFSRTRWFQERTTHYEARVIRQEEGSRKIAQIKSIRSHFGWGLLEAKQFVDGLRPSPPIPKDLAAQLERELTDLGARLDFVRVSLPRTRPYRRHFGDTTWDDMPQDRL